MIVLGLNTWLCQFPQSQGSEDRAGFPFCLGLKPFLMQLVSRRFESKDHARPWFCQHLYFLGVSSSPIGLSPRTMQDLNSIQHLYFIEVAGFPIGLSPRTMQDLSSVQLLYFLVTSFPIGLSLRTMQDIDSVQHLYFIEVAGFPIGLSPTIMQDLGSVQLLYFLVP